MNTQRFFAFSTARSMPTMHSILHFFKKILPLGLAFTMAACNSEVPFDPATDTTAVAKLVDVPGRQLSSLSVHPNSEEIMFVEFKEDLPSVSRVLRYHLKTGALQYYDLPATHVYLDAAFAPNGNTIVMRRAPNVRGDEEVKRKAYEASEIVTMKADGSDLKVVPLAPGLKFSPVMSHNGKYIAYWRATQRPDGSKSFASKFDIWEVNLETGKDQPFAGRHEFFAGGSLQYLKDDQQLLASADTPTSQNEPGRTPGNLSSWMREQTKKFNDSTIYVLKRGDELLPMPIATDVNSARRPSADRFGNYYFFGYKPKSSYFMTNGSKEHTQWRYPGRTIGSSNEVVVLPNGKAIVFTFDYKNSPPRGQSTSGIAVFDIERASWTQVDIPSLQNAAATPVLPRGLTQ